VQMAHVCVEPKRRRYSIVQTPVAGKRSTDSSGAPNISHIRKNSDERGEDGEKERERYDTANARQPAQCLRSGSMYETLPR